MSGRRRSIVSKKHRSIALFSVITDVDYLEIVGVKLFVKERT